MQWIGKLSKIFGHLSIKATKKKSRGSHQLLSNFYNKKKSQAPCQILSLGKHLKCMHFSDDMVFFNLKTNLLTLIIFLFFSGWEPKHLFFNFKKINKKNKKFKKEEENRLSSSFSIFFLMRTKTFILCDLKNENVSLNALYHELSWADRIPFLNHYLRKNISHYCIQLNAWIMKMFSD